MRCWVQIGFRGGVGGVLRSPRSADPVYNPRAQMRPQTPPVGSAGPARWRVFPRCPREEAPSPGALTASRRSLPSCTAPARQAATTDCVCPAAATAGPGSWTPGQLPAGRPAPATCPAAHGSREHRTSVCGGPAPRELPKPLAPTPAPRDRQQANQNALRPSSSVCLSLASQGTARKRVA